LGDLTIDLRRLLPLRWPRRCGRAGVVVVLAVLGVISFAARDHARSKICPTPMSEEQFLNRFGGGDPDRFRDCGNRESKLAEIVCRIGAAAYSTAGGFYSTSDACDKDRSYYFAAFAALETMNVGQNLLSSARFSLQALTSKEPLPINTVAECVDNWIGICGNHVDFFLHVMKELGVPARPVQIFYEARGTRNSHIVAEVHYAGGWRLFDITNGAVFPSERPLLFRSLQDTKGRSGAKPMVNNNNTWFSMHQVIGVNSFEYLDTEPLGIIAGHIGTIKLWRQADAVSPISVEGFLHVPNHIGDNQIDGDRAGVSFEVAATGRNRVRIETIGAAGCQDEAGDRIVIGGNRVPTAQKAVDVVVDGAFKLGVESTQDVCYVVMRQMEVLPQ
jgi:hypothetical protein